MPLTKDDTGEQALNIMHVYHVRELPLVEHNQFIALITEEFILNNNLEETIGSYRLPYSTPSVFENDHLFDVLQKISANKLSVMPVVNSKAEYLGSITSDDLLHYLGNSYSFTEMGSIIILETDRSNYSLGEITRIAESENISILASFIHSDKESTQIFITLKLNSFDISRVVNAYQRHDYLVSSIFSNEEYIDILKDRYDSLMHFINI